MNTRTKRAVSKIETEVEAVETEAKDVKAEIKAKFEEVVEQAKTRSQENRLMMLGLIANARKAREERKANLIEAGRAYEPELQAKLDELKSKFKIGEGKDAQLTEGTSGYIVCFRGRTYKWEEGRDYLWPIPTDQRVATGGALSQNPGYEDGLSF